MAFADKIASPDLDAKEDRKVPMQATSGGEILEINELTVDEPLAQVLMEQGNPFAHAVEHGLNQSPTLLSRALAGGLVGLLITSSKPSFRPPRCTAGISWQGHNCIVGIAGRITDCACAVKR